MFKRFSFNLKIKDREFIVFVGPQDVEKLQHLEWLQDLKKLQVDSF